MNVAALHIESDTPQHGAIAQRARWHRLGKWVAAMALAFPALVVAGAVAQPWTDPKWLFLDPLTVAEVSGDCCHVYYGLISNLGIMLWSATSAVCLFAAFALFGTTATHEPTVSLATAGLLTGWLALDDVFLLHELVIPTLGFMQNAVLAFYVLLGICYVIASWRVILASNYILFVVAGAFLAASMFVDIAFHSASSELVVIEDGAKFIGIWCWALFQVTTALRLLNASRSAPLDVG